MGSHVKVKNNPRSSLFKLLRGLFLCGGVDQTARVPILQSLHCNGMSALCLMAGTEHQYRYVHRDQVCRYEVPQIFPSTQTEQNLGHFT